MRSLASALHRLDSAAFARRAGRTAERVAVSASALGAVAVLTVACAEDGMRPLVVTGTARVRRLLDEKGPPSA